MIKLATEIPQNEQLRLLCHALTKNKDFIEASREDVCIAFVNFFTEILLAQPNYANPNELRQFWRDVLENGLLKCFQLVSNDHTMKAGKQAVEKFFRSLDKI